MEKDALWGEPEESLAIDWCDYMENELEHNYPSMADTHPGWDDAAVAIDCDAGFLERLTNDCLRQWIASVDFSHCQSIMDFESDALFVTFNYTDVLEDVYGIEPARVFHVHGRASDRSDCLQFGTPNNDPKGVEVLLEQEFADDEYYDAVVKPCARMAARYSGAAFKNPRLNYQKLKAFFDGAEPSRIHIMGNTYDGVDEPYYEDVFAPMFKTADWFFYNHKWGCKAAAEEYYRMKEFAQRMGLANTSLCAYDDNYLR